MANVLLDIGKGIEVAAEDALKFLSGASSAVNKAASVEPSVVAALGAVFGSLNAAIVGISGAAASDGLNIALDVQTVTDLKAVWPSIESFLSSLGVKL